MFQDFAVPENVTKIFPGLSRSCGDRAEEMKIWPTAMLFEHYYKSTITTSIYTILYYSQLHLHPVFTVNTL